MFEFYTLKFKNLECKIQTLQILESGIQILKLHDIKFKYPKL